MNDLEEIEKVINNYVCEEKQSKLQIFELEDQRMKLASQRNEKKQYKIDYSTADINELGQKISELGNKSQELQNKLDSKFFEVKKIVDLTINNEITDKIRKIRKMDEEKQELEAKILNQTGKNAKYEMRKQEFLDRFGRIPELSAKAQKEEEIQSRQSLVFQTRINEIEKNITDMEKELINYAAIKRNFKNRDWDSIIEIENIEEVKTVQEPIEESIELPLIEEFQVEELEPTEYINVNEFKPIQNVEIGEIEIEEGIDKIEENIEQNNIEVINEPNQPDEIEVLARAIVEEIIAEQTKENNKENEEEQEIIAFEDLTKKNSLTEKLEKENITLSNIIAKVEDGEIVYKAQVNNGEEIKIYPTLEVRNILLNDKEYREEIKEFLVNYAIVEHKIFDYTVIKKIDPTVCEVLERFAKKYNFDERNLIYNYAMSFSQKFYNEVDTSIPITYNLSYLKNTNLSNKEKSIISKICKKATANENIDIIGGVAGFGRIKYIFKKIFKMNNVNALPEGKY